MTLNAPMNLLGLYLRGAHIGWACGEFEYAADAGCPAAFDRICHEGLWPPLFGRTDLQSDWIKLCDYASARALEVSLKAPDAVWLGPYLDHRSGHLHDHHLVPYSSPLSSAYDPGT